MRLKIGDTVFYIPLVGVVFFLLLNLLANRKRGFGSKVSTPPPRAINTSASGAFSINVRASKSNIERELGAFCANRMAQIVVVCI